MTSQQSSKLGAYIGSFIGSMGWLLGLIGVAYNAGAQDFLKEIVPIGFLISFSFFIVLVLLCELIYEKGLRKNIVLYQTTLFGIILFFAGTLIHVMNYWIAPKIDNHLNLRNALKNMGSVYKVSDIFVLVFLFVGCVFLIISLILFKKQSRKI